MAISHLTYIKDASGLAQAKGLPSLIYHEPAIEVKFMRGAAGTTRILTIRELVRFLHSHIAISAQKDTKGTNRFGDLK